jgi:hypothetical protein
MNNLDKFAMVPLDWLPGNCDWDLDVMEFAYYLLGVKPLYITYEQIAASKLALDKLTVMQLLGELVTHGVVSHLENDDFIFRAPQPGMLHKDFMPRIVFVCDKCPWVEIGLPEDRIASLSLVGGLDSGLN